MSCSHDHQQHCAGTSLVLIHFRDLNAFALHIVIFYRSFSFFFFFFFFLSFFFPFFLFFFLHTDLNIPGRTSLNLLPVPKCGGGSSADVVSSSTLLNFPCIRHKCHVTSWGLAILLVFPFRKKRKQHAPTVPKSEIFSWAIVRAVVRGKVLTWQLTSWKTTTTTGVQVET